MRKVRAAIAVVVALGVGVIAAMFVAGQINKKGAQKPKPPVTKPKVVKQARRESNKIPPGMRVITVKVDQFAGDLKRIRPGDRVDVIAVSKVPGLESATVSRVVLEDVGVYAVRGKEGQTQGKFSPRRKFVSVSLLLNPEQATMLSAAQRAADIKIALLGKGGEKAGFGERRPPEYAFSPGSGPVRLGPKRGDLGALIPRGMRAVTIRVKDTDGICGDLRPGDRVDVIATCPISKFASGGSETPGTKGVVTEFRISSKVLLENVEVLSTDMRPVQAADPKARTRLVTLLTTPKDAVTVTAACDGTKKDILRLVTRRPDDTGKSYRGRVALADIMSEIRVYSRVYVIKGNRIHQSPVFQ